ncbi:maleate cis-trans isomerase family protein [Candidatus Spongiihabitans sp.]|uniref:maleate cis-trans isomerase family protein n=1 Tax=Candidatus Spongiihabitans sp. TaxID=3101308 RepID=UPI003C79C39B
MFDDSRGRGRIGVVVPYTNTNLEPDLTAMRPDGVSMHFTRIAGYELNCAPNTSTMQALGNAPMDASIDLLTAIRPDIILYGCTSATLALGRRADLALAIRLTAYSGLPVVTASNAVINALTDIAVSKIVICTPYDHQLSEVTTKFFEDSGFNVISVSRIEKVLDSLGQGAISCDEITRLALKADQQKAEAIVIVCTDLRAVECINTIESLTGKPVISSNQALLYAATKVLGVSRITIPGTLGNNRVACDRKPTRVSGLAPISAQ